VARVIGAKAHASRLRALTGPGMIRRVGAALMEAGKLIQVEAQVSITTGAVSGKNHVPSNPGEPPNQNWGTLGNNIEVVSVAPLKVEVSSNASYAAALEFGTSKMGERPYMRPATAKKRKEVVALVRGAVSSAIRSSKGA
jgi:HK97 gp10 family phage protein